jgi:hypothetical protein
VETWTSRELAVLGALVDKFENDDESHMTGVSVGALVVATGFAKADVEKALRTLDRASPPYMEGHHVNELPYPVTITAVTERALRAVGQWPASDDAAEAIIAALTEAAESEPDEEKRSGLRRTAAFLGGAGKEIFYRILTSAASGEISQHMPPHL